mmetsp:Transcript_29870/g.92814  ORF Transcript_29870/g.92814 Transcript_29870/m.92814 type:complete len:211 (+) Transcript_29870:112-744(+)
MQRDVPFLLRRLAQGPEGQVVLPVLPRAPVPRGLRLAGGAPPAGRVAGVRAPGAPLDAAPPPRAGSRAGPRAHRERRPQAPIPGAQAVRGGCREGSPGPFGGARAQEENERSPAAASQQCRRSGLRRGRACWSCLGRRHRRGRAGWSRLGFRHRREGQYPTPGLHVRKDLDAASGWMQHLAPAPQEPGRCARVLHRARQAGISFGVLPQA